MNCPVSDPQVQAAIDTVFQAGKTHNVPSGIYAPLSGISIENRINQGWQFVVVGNDLNIITGGAQQILRSLGKVK
jgi:2-keto-3-deoxy-L-rhamnonate aldolase RhmA